MVTARIMLDVLAQRSTTVKKSPSYPDPSARAGRVRFFGMTAAGTNFLCACRKLGASVCAPRQTDPLDLMFSLGGLMKYLRMLQFALAAFVFCPVAAHAQSLVGSMGGVNLNLVVPRGYCIPDPDNSADAAFVEFLAKLMENSKNHLMRVVVNCRELQARRSDAKKPIHEYVQFYFPMASEKVTLTGDPETLRKDSCD